MRLFSYLMRECVSAVFTECLILEAKSLHYSVKTGIMTKKSHRVNHLLEAYSTEAVVAEMGYGFSSLLQDIELVAVGGR